VKRVWR